MDKCLVHKTPEKSRGVRGSLRFRLRPNSESPDPQTESCKSATDFQEKVGCCAMSRSETEPKSNVLAVMNRYPASPERIRIH